MRFVGCLTSAKLVGAWDAPYKTPEEFFKTEEAKAALGISEEEIKRMVEERAEAKRSKEFKRADEIRNQLLEKGVILEDGAKGTTWKVA